MCHCMCRMFNTCRWTSHKGGQISPLMRILPPFCALSWIEVFPVHCLSLQGLGLDKASRGGGGAHVPNFCTSLLFMKTGQGQAEFAGQETCTHFWCKCCYEMRGQGSQSCKWAAFQKCCKFCWHQNLFLNQAYQGLTFLYQCVLKAFQSWWGCWTEKHSLRGVNTLHRCCWEFRTTSWGWEMTWSGDRLGVRGWRGAFEQKENGKEMLQWLRNWAWI